MMLNRLRIISEPVENFLIKLRMRRGMHTKLTMNMNKKDAMRRS
jgi:hypothetical protein